MAQIAPFLEVPKNAAHTALPGSPEERTPDVKREVAILLAGPMRRLGALAFDLCILYGIFRALSAAFTEQLYGAGKWGSFGAAILTLLYFALGDGPVGRGATIGKFLVGIRVTRYDGSVLTVPQALLRTGLAFPFLVFRHFIDPIWVDDANFVDGTIRMLLEWALPFAMFVGTCLAMGFNPYRQAIHDYVARTLVRPARAEHLAFDELASILGTGAGRLHRQPFINGVVTSLLVWTALVIVTWPGKYHKDARGAYTAIHSLPEKTNFPADSISTAFLFVGGEVEDLTREEMEKEYVDFKDEDSSHTLRLVIHLTRVGGRWSEDPEIITSKTREVAEGYREALQHFGAEAIYPEPQGRPGNILGRPLIFDIRLGQALELLYPFQYKIADKRRHEFPPIKPVTEAAALSGS